MRIGLIEFEKWVYLMILMDTQAGKNQELVKTCLVRGKLMEEIARQVSGSKRSFSYFLTGLFSSLDALLGRPMPDILRELPLPPEVSTALLGQRNNLRTALDSIIAYERAEWDALEQNGFFGRVPMGLFMSAYFDTLQWVNQIQ